jgi:hypothetical protein
MGIDLNKFSYSGYIPTLSNRFEAMLGSIAAFHNFDLGDEFEVGICEILGETLPQQFGICRGHIVSKDGQQVGDDIIIFDQVRFPTLRNRGARNFSRKEHVPAESVYAYIEAKHSLRVDSDNACTYQKAWSQIADVKKLLAQRTLTTPNEFIPGVTLSSLVVETPQGYPKFLNPIFTMILGRNVEDEEGKRLADPKAIDALLLKHPGKYGPSPDLVVAGRSNLIFSCRDSDKRKLIIPFLRQGDGQVTAVAEGVSYGVCLATLMWALDFIRLGRMPWAETIQNALNR